MNHNTVANNAGLVFVVHLSVDDQSAGHRADLRDLEHLFHLYLARHDFLLHLVEHAFHGRLDVVDGVVNNRIGVDLHAFALSQFAGVGRRAYLESHDDGVGCRSQHHIVLGDLSYGLGNDVHLHLLGRQFDERVGEGLDRSVHVTLHDDVQLVELTQCDAVRDVVQTQRLRGAQRLFALQLCALVGNLACLLLGLHHMEGVTGCRGTVQTQDDGGLGGSGTLDALVTLVEHGLDASVAGSSHDDVAHLQRTVAHEHRRHVAASFVQCALDDASRGLAVGVGFQVEHLGFQQNLLQKVVYADTFLGADLLTLVLTAPVFYQQVHVGQVLAYLVGVGTRLINLVDGKHHRYVGSLGMCDGLLGGWHHAVVGSNDDDGNIGHLGTTGTHGGEGLVTRRVEEGDPTAVLQFHVIGSDMLGDTTGLTGNHVGVADMVEQRCLTVVDMSHHGHDGRAAHQVVLVVILLGDGVLHLGTYIFCGESELVGHNIDGLSVESLVDAHHDANRHTGADDLVHTHVHHRGQLRDGHKLSQLEHLALCCLGGHLLAHALLHSLALLLTVFGAFLVLALRGQACQCLFHLACHILLVHLQRLLVALLLVLLVVAAGIGIAALVVLTSEVAVLAGSLDVDTLAANARALLFLLVVAAIVVASTGLGSLLLALFAALLLRFLLRTGALVQCVEVDLTLYLQLRGIVQHLLLVLGHKDLRLRAGCLCVSAFSDCWLLGRSLGLGLGLWLLNGFRCLGSLRLRLGLWLCFRLNLWLRFWLSLGLGFRLGLGLWLRFSLRCYHGRLFLFGRLLCLGGLGLCLDRLSFLLRLRTDGSGLCLRVQTLQVDLPQHIELLAVFL